MAYNNQKNSKIELGKIELDYEKDEQLFGETAEKWSKQLFQDSSKTVNNINQIRKFYDKVLELQEKADGISDNEEYKKKIFPFVIMLKSKASYAKTRNLVSDSFVKMINNCVDDAKTIEKMQNFKYFFEAIIGFYPKK